jgi:sugar lactone lactonase YvrE
MKFIGAASVYVVCAVVGGLYVYGCSVSVPETSQPVLMISPAAIPLGQSAKLSWTWTDSTTQCKTGNTWVGSGNGSSPDLATAVAVGTSSATGTGGTQAVTPPTVSTVTPPPPGTSPWFEYDLTCYAPENVLGSKGLIPLMTRAYLNVYNPPTIQFPSSAPILAGGSVALTWGETNAASCTASGGITGDGWAGSTLAISQSTSSGTFSVNTPASTPAGPYTYTITCTEDLDATVKPTASAILTVTGPVIAPPTVNLTLNPTSIPSDGSVPATLQWTTVNATSCTASGTWAGTPVTPLASGSIQVAPSTPGTYTYGLICTGAGGPSLLSSATLTVTTPVIVPAPAVTLGVSPSSIAVGASALLTWSSTNATSCVAGGAWSGAQNVSGTLSVSPTTAGPYSYTLSCTGAGGTSPVSSVVLNVTAPSPPVAISNPNALKIHNGKLYVANSGSGQVLIYSPGPSGTMVQQPALNLKAGLSNPVRLAFDTTGDLFVSDIGNNSVVVFDPSGNQLSAATISVQRPLGVAVDTTGVVYVAENTAGALAVFRYPSGLSAAPTAATTWSIDSTGLMFTAPGDVAFGGGNVLLAVASNAIAFYSPASLQMTSGSLVPAQPAITSGINGPTGIAFDAGSNIYVTNYYPGTVTEYTASGTPVALALSGTSGMPIATPEGVAVDSSGNIYVSNAPNNVIDVYTSLGTYLYSLQ